ncbi:hypothetical protein ACIA5C_03130 [Actinoplanes sp. NPDC051343]|uniref:hypothetical protein n=1 Tax=Actinoplanes sp. NPDC051343 TaxID=3363906 RepID=UPI0037B2366A
MLIAERTSMFRGRYRMVADGREVANWDPSWWRTGGSFEIDGYRFEVRSNGWGTKFRMLDQAGDVLALVERVGRKHWSAEADGRVYEFRRASFWGKEQELIVGGVRAGYIRRTSGWTGAVEADLPGVPLPTRIFLVGVQIAHWQAQQNAAAAS